MNEKGFAEGLGAQDREELGCSTRWRGNTDKKEKARGGNEPASTWDREETPSPTTGVRRGERGC